MLLSHHIVNFRIDKKIRISLRIMIKKFGNGLAGGQIVSAVIWQQKVNDYSKKL